MDAQPREVHLFPSRVAHSLVQIAFSRGSQVFYGGPDETPVGRYPLGLTNVGDGFREQTRYQGLSAIAERDELFLTVRYTF